MTNFQPRSLDALQNDFYRYLSASNSQLTDTSQGSVLYTLSRAVSALAVEQDNRLYEFASAYFVDSAVGSQLDDLAGNYGVRRKPSRAAQGYLLVTRSPTYPDTFSLLPNSTFTELNTGFQVITLNDEVININSLTEQLVPVITSTTGFGSNLTEGTRLYLTNDVSIESVVGNHRTSAGEACGSLTGGRDQESDLELKIRLISFINSRRGTTEDSIRSVLESDTNVEWIHFQTPQPGYVQVWVDSAIQLSLSALQTLRDSAESAKPAGVVLTVQQAARELIDLKLNLMLSASVDKDQVCSQVTEECQAYIVGLPLAGVFNSVELQNILESISGVLSAEVISPETSFSAPEQTVLRIQKLEICTELT